MNTTTNLFNININLVILSVNMTLNKRYILSLSKNEIILPRIINANKNKTLNINQTIIEYLQSLKVADNHLLLMPQIISIDSKYINEDTNTLNCIFGLLVDYNPSIIDSYWYEFEYAIPNKYSGLIIEVAQKLQ